MWVENRCSSPAAPRQGMKWQGKEARGQARIHRDADGFQQPSRRDPTDAMLRVSRRRVCVQRA